MNARSGGAGQMNRQKMEQDRPALAREIMVSPAVTAPANATVREVARLMLAHGVSTLPVLDEQGRLVGMASDGDLLGRRSEDSLRDWWLSMLVEGDPSGPSLTSASARTVREVMSAPAIAITPTATVYQAAELLQTHRIKRVPVVEAGRVLGVLSRSDLLPMIAAASAPAIVGRGGSGLLAFLESLVGGTSLLGLPEARPSRPEAEPEQESWVTISAEGFRTEVQAHQIEEADRRQLARRKAALEHGRMIKALLDKHVSDALWRELLAHAEQAARAGEKEFLLLRFPSDLCGDGGRKIDVAEQGWEDTLRGEAAELYHRWRKDLKPRGFGLSARIVSYVEGMLGDIGLFLTWGL